MISFPKYADIKDRYCICYFGHSDEYLVQLRLIKPVIERNLLGLTVYIGCQDAKSHLLQDCNHTLKATELKSKRYEFGHIKEIKYNGSTHPIEDLLLESGIHYWPVCVKDLPEETRKCVLITDGNYPTMPIEKHKIEAITKQLRQEGYEVELNSNIAGAGLVVGVESVELFEAAAKGIKTRLIPTGVGARLYKSMFSNSDLMDN